MDNNNLNETPVQPVQEAQPAPAPQAEAQPVQEAQPAPAPQAEAQPVQEAQPTPAPQAAPQPAPEPQPAPAPQPVQEAAEEVTYSYNDSYEDNEENAGGGKGLSIASLILGILSIVCCWTPCLNFIFGLVGMILGIVAKKKKAAGPATAGMIISIIGTVISLLIVLIYLILVIISIINNS